MCKVAITAGANGGIGCVLVQLYIADEYLVTELDKTPSEECNSASYIEVATDFICFTKDRKYRSNIVGDFICYLPTNLSEFVDVKNAAEQILKTVPDIERKDWEQSLSVNAIAAFFIVRALIAELGASREHVVNIFSIHAKLSKSNVICYATSKTAVEGITRLLALQLSPLGISIDTVATATIAKQILNAGFSGAPMKLREIEHFHLSRSIDESEQVANFIKAITDQRIRFLTGSILKINGGKSAKHADSD